MEIPWTDLCERLATLPDPQAFAVEHGIGMMTDFANMQVFPPNSEQSAMRSALAALGYDFGDDEEVSISTHTSPLVDN